MTVFHTIWSPIQSYPLRCTCVSLSHFLSQMLSSEHWIEFSLGSFVALPGLYFCSTSSAEMFFVKVSNTLCLDQVIQLQTPGYVRLVAAWVVTGSTALLWLLRCSHRYFYLRIAPYHFWVISPTSIIFSKSLFLNSCPQSRKLLKFYVDTEDLQTGCSRWFSFDLKSVLWMSSCISLVT